MCHHSRPENSGSSAKHHSSLQAATRPQPDRPKTPQEKILDVVRAAESQLEIPSSPVIERRTEIVMSGHHSRSSSTLNLTNNFVVETPPVHQEVELESTYINVIPTTSTPKAREREKQEEEQISPPIPSIPHPQDQYKPPIPNEETTPRKRTLPASRPAIAPKPSNSARATSEPPSGHIVLSGGEPVSLPPTGEQSQDSPMPELLSLKDRLRLFEKEIDDQQKIPEPKKDRKFSFLSDDEVVKMKEEEAKRIASMTALDLEAFDSLTSHLSLEEDTNTVLGQVNELSKYDCSSEVGSKPVQEDGDDPAKTLEVSIVTNENLTEAERKAAWRKARLDSLEDDAIQAQIVIDRMSGLGGTIDTVDVGTKPADDNFNYRHSVDTQGNITGTRQYTHEEEDETDSEMTTSEDTTTGKTSPAFIQPHCVGGQ